MPSLQIQLGLIPSISCILSFFVFYVTGGGTLLGFHRHIFEFMFPRPALLPTNQTSDQQNKSQNRHHLDNARTYKLQPKFPSFPITSCGGFGPQIEVKAEINMFTDFRYRDKKSNAFQLDSVCVVVFQNGPGSIVKPFVQFPIKESHWKTSN